jgi:hypothetical protein
MTWSFADNRDGYNYPARNVDTDKDMPRSSRQKADKMMIQDQPITPDAGPRVARGADVFVTADFIYWNVRQDGLAYANTGTIKGFLLLTDQNIATKGHVFHPDFKWEPGFKVGLGMNLSHDGWDLYAQYTWLRSKPNRTSKASVVNDVNNLKANWQVYGLDPLVDDLIYADTKWRLRFNVIDLELGRNFYASKFLTMRPHIGLKGSWQDDDLVNRYRFIPMDLSQVRMRNNIDYWGIGVRTGSNNAWYFMRNFCLFGDFALSALWSRFEIRRKDFNTRDFVNEPENEILHLHTENTVRSLKAVLELTIGLRYDVWWSDDDYHFGLQAGWEEQLWFSHNQHYKVLEEGAHGDLTLQGLTVKARLDF